MTISDRAKICQTLFPHTYSLHHDTVHPQLFIASGVVEDVDPGESQREHEEAEVLSPSTAVQNGTQQKERGLQEAANKAKL